MVLGVMYRAGRLVQYEFILNRHIFHTLKTVEVSWGKKSQKKPSYVTTFSGIFYQTHPNLG